MFACGNLPWFLFAGFSARRSRRRRSRFGTNRPTATSRTIAFAPTAVSLTSGSNDVIGSVVGNPSDIDYQTINVPTGDELSPIILESFTSTDQKGFIGIQQGTTFTEPATGTNVANLLGYTHFGPGAGNVGLDILPGMGQGRKAKDFTGPLASGSYTFWIQQLGALTNYDFNFVVRPVPEPATWGMATIAAGLCTLAAARKKIRRQ